MSEAERPVGLAAEWHSVLAGDKDQFRWIVEPHLAELTGAAEKELRYRPPSATCGRKTSRPRSWWAKPFLGLGATGGASPLSSMCALG